MRYEFNGKMLTIPDKQIETNMRTLKMTKEQAIQLWLEDNGYLVNEEQEEFIAKVGKVKVSRGAKSETEKKETKPRTVKVSTEKAQIWTDLVDFLSENYTVSVKTDNKLLEIEFNGKHFKVNLSEDRPK